MTDIKEIEANQKEDLNEFAITPKETRRKPTKEELKKLFEKENLLPRYFSDEEKKIHRENLEKLFDLNFGKDWRVFVTLYYLKKACRHSVSYNGITPEESKKFKWGFMTARKFFFIGCKKIITDYLIQGFNYTKEVIATNKYRFMWAFSKSEPKQIIISDELFFAIEKRKQEKIIKEVKEELKEKETEENISLITEEKLFEKEN